MEKRPQVINSNLISIWGNLGGAFLVRDSTRFYFYYITVKLNSISNFNFNKYIITNYFIISKFNVKIILKLNSA